MANKLNKNEIELLQQAINDMELGDDIKQKAIVILDYCRNPNKQEVCNKYKIEQRTVQRWIKKLKQSLNDGQYGLDKLHVLMNKPFVKPRHITDKQIESILSYFKENPIKYNLAYSIWDEFTIKQFLEQRYPDITLSSATILKILRRCQLVHNNKFFDHNCTRAQDYANLLNDTSKLYIYFNYFYLGSKQYFTKYSSSSIVEGHFWKYYFGILMQTTKGDVWIDTQQEEKHKKFDWNNKSLCFEFLAQYFKNRHCIIVTDGKKSTRLAIQGFYEPKTKYNNIKFLTIPAACKIDKNKYLDNATKVKSHIYTSRDKKKRNKPAYFDQDTKLAFTDANMETVLTRFNTIVKFCTNIEPVVIKLKRHSKK